MTETIETVAVRTIGRASAIDLLTEVVQAKGDGYRYLDHHHFCQNFNSTTREPMCIVGHALHSLGLTHGECGEGPAALVMRSITRDPDIPVEFTRDAMVILSAAQGVQDKGGTWGEALSASKAVSYAINYTTEFNFEGAE